MQDANIHIQGLTKSFKRPDGGDHLVLSDITLDVEAGEFVAIVGASGCGKTTLLRLISGLETRDSGVLSQGDREVTGPGRGRGFVFQNDSLFPWRTVKANVAFGLEMLGVPSKERNATAVRLLETVGLKGFEEHYPAQLSGGMRQRVNLARAMAIDPPVLLMDEPFAALDAQTREMMQEELLRIWATNRPTVVFITHQIEEAVFLADRVVVLGARPGTVRRSVPIDLARPRDLHIKRSEKFVQYVDEIWELIEKEARASLIATA